MSLGTGVIALKLGTSALKAGMGRVKAMMKGAMGGIRSIISGGMKMAMAGMAVGFAGGILLMRKSLQLLDVQRQAEAKLGAVIKSTGGAAGLSAEQMKKYASSLQEITKYGDEDTINMMSILATFKEIKGDIFKAATKAAMDMSTVLGTDLKSSAIMLGKALNDPIKGLSTLSRSGVTFSKSQEDMIRSLVKAGKVQEAQVIMLNELKSQFGGAAEAAAGTFGGAVQQMKNAIGDAMEVIGGELAPHLLGLVNRLKELAPRMGEIGVRAIQWGVAFWELGKPIREVIGKVFVAAMKIAKNAIEIGIAIAKNWPLVWDYVVAEVTATLIGWADKASQIFRAVWDVGRKAFENLTENVAVFFANLWNEVTGEATDWDTMWRPMGEGLKDALTNAMKDSELAKLAREEAAEAQKAMKDAIVGDIVDARIAASTEGPKSASDWKDALKYKLPEVDASTVGTAIAEKGKAGAKADRGGMISIADMSRQIQQAALGKEVQRQQLEEAKKQTKVAEATQKAVEAMVPDLSRTGGHGPAAAWAAIPSTVGA